MGSKAKSTNYLIQLSNIMRNLIFSVLLETSPAILFESPLTLEKDMTLPIPSPVRQTRRLPFVLSLFALFGILHSVPVHADVKLPAIFGDHMVLQRDLAVSIWGTAAPGESVTVTAGRDRAATVTGPNGKWTATLGKLAASAKPVDVTITGKNTLVLHDVLIGDVWVCSGQSNMEYGIKAFLPKEEFEETAEPQIRVFMVPKVVAPAPEADIAPAPANAPLLGTWQICSPDMLSKTGEWSGFPAVAYFFGRDVHNFTHQPVGLIGSCWGGTRINCWTSLQALESSPEMKSFAVGAAKFRDNYQQIKDNYLNVVLPQWKAESERWNTENKAAVESYNAAQAQWRQQARDAAAAKKPAPPRPVPPAVPKEPRDPIHDNQTTCALFNGMIAPLLHFGIKGVVWYQGESNADNPKFYETALPLLINDWRKQWAQGDFPFLFVQLPSYMARKPSPSEGPWAGFREAQARALSLPATGMAVTVDIGDAGNIHPPDKWDVGARLALIAQHVAYGQQGGIYSGPTYKSFSVEGNKIRIAFDNVGGGLIVSNPPEHFYLGSKQPVPSAPPAALEGFAIAGADHKFVWAKASIDGASITVSNDAVPNPVAVRYAWADNPACNLYNKEGLPAAPFRTDDLPLANK